MNEGNSSDDRDRLYTASGLPIVKPATRDGTIASSGNADSLSIRKVGVDIREENPDYISTVFYLLESEYCSQPLNSATSDKIKKALQLGYNLLSRAAEDNDNFARSRISPDGEIGSVEEVIGALEERLAEQAKPFVDPLRKFQDRYAEALKIEGQIKNAAVRAKTGLAGKVFSTYGALDEEEYKSLNPEIKAIYDRVNTALNGLAQATSLSVVDRGKYNEVFNPLIAKAYGEIAELILETNRSFKRCDDAEQKLSHTQLELKHVIEERDELSVGVDALLKERDGDK